MDDGLKVRERDKERKCSVKVKRRERKAKKVKKKKRRVGIDKCLWLQGQNARKKRKKQGAVLGKRTTEVKDELNRRNERDREGMTSPCLFVCKSSLLLVSPRVAPNFSIFGQPTHPEDRVVKKVE